MFNNKYNIVDEGFYSHSQSNGCMLVKQYIMVEKEAKKLLLLRFWNASELVVNSMEIVITQIGADKQVIDTSVVQIEGIKVNPGNTYTTTSGVVISDKCVDFKVFVKYVRSGMYEYYERGGKTVAKYKPQSATAKKSKGYGRAIVSKQRMHAGRLAAAVAVLLMLGFIILSVYLSARII